MKKITLLILLVSCINLMQAQTSPDYILGDGNGSTWSWATGTLGTSSLGGSYLWKFKATLDIDEYFKIAETNSIVDGSGFWLNSSSTNMQYTGAGTKWTAYNKPNLNDGGAIYWTMTLNNYYVIKTKLNGSNVDFAIFDNGATSPVTISSVAGSYTSPNLLVDATLSAAKGANEKVWIRYTTNNWVSSSTLEASVNTSGNVWRATIPLTGGELVKYYAYTTVQQTVAPAETDADFFTVSYNNNGGVNYTYKNGNMSGNYYIGNNGTAPGGTDPDFNYLRQACDALNTSTISGDVNLFITSNLTEPVDVTLGVNAGTNKITIKPAVGVNPTITFQNIGVSVSIDGHFVIGSPNANSANLISTNNVTIDGSNTDGGTTKDMTFIGSASSVARSVFRIYANCDGITIKNCTITTQNTSGTSNGSIQLTDYTTLAPDNFTALNNTLNASSGNGSLGAFISVSGTPTALMTGIKIQNNIITSRATRAIMFNYVSDGEISGNTISHDLQLGTGAAQTIAVMSGGLGVAGTFNIFNNKITQVKTWNTATGPTASNGAIAIDNQLASPKIVNIYNNFITGFAINSATVQGVKIYGIRHIGGSTSNVYNNTIVIPEMTDMTTTTGSFIAGIAFATNAVAEAAPAGTMNVKNNVIISNETTMKVWGIRRVGTTGTFTSDYNNIFATTSNNYVGYFNASDAASLANWQTASSLDANSKSKEVQFVSTTDLHLAGTSLSDADLYVPAISTVTLDIEGDLRNATTTYMGADHIMPFITSSGNEVTLAKDANSAANVDITSNVNWSVSSDQSWLAPSLTVSSGNKTLTLTAESNPSSSDRSANVTITTLGTEPKAIKGKNRVSATTNSSTSVTINVTQSGLATKVNNLSVNYKIFTTSAGILATFNGVANIELYSINGLLIEKTNATGSYTRELSHGAYVIRINGKSTKFVK